MENENKTSFLDKIKIFLKRNIFIFISLITIVIIFAIFLGYNNYAKNINNEKISEKYIKAGIFLTLNKKEDSNFLLQEIIRDKNEFYSILSLNTIIDNNLEKNSDEVLKLFNIIENISKDKEQNNLIKLKKALFLIKISREVEGMNILNEIISDKSIWRDTALEIINE